MIQLKYNGQDSYSDFNLVVKSSDRTMLPSLTQRQLAVAGKHGTWDFKGNTYENRIISVEFKYVGSTFLNLRSKARDIAHWLSQTEAPKKLIFSDEPDKYYLAKIYSSVGLQNILRVGQGSIEFECKPFAYSTAQDLILATITTDPQVINVTVTGTAETPEIITMTNNSGITIDGFTLSREVEVY